MKLQKILILLCLLLLTTGMTASAAELTSPKLRQVRSTEGRIVEKEIGSIVVEGKGNFKKVKLILTADTHIVDAKTGDKIELKDLKKNAKVIAYYPPAMTKSIPPQTSAIAIVVGDPEDAGMYMMAKEVTLNDKGAKILCTNQDRIVTINSDILADVEKSKAGDEFLVWYKVITMSLPGQATATKAIRLSPVQADIKIHMLAGVIVVNGQELALAADDAIVYKNNTVLVPLRIITEKLGYEIIWQAKTKTAILQKGPQSATLTVGSKDYGRQKMRVQLDNAPEMLGSKLLVPVEFFTHVLGLEVSISRDHV